MIIDTNVYSALDAGIQSAIDAVISQTTVHMPLFVVAELQFGFKNGTRHEINSKRLQQFLSQQNVEVVLPTLKTAMVYAEISVFCRSKGRVLSQNDLWIAALAKENQETLVTYDKDFSVFNDILGDKLQILNH